MNAEERVTQTREVLDSTRQQVAHLSQVEHEIKSQLDSVNEQLEYSQQEYEDMKVQRNSSVSHFLDSDGFFDLADELGFKVVGVPNIGGKVGINDVYEFKVS